MKSDRSKAPLRKIVDTFWPFGPGGSAVEVLECGHQQNQLQDHIGPTNANRRRCSKCFRGEGPDRNLLWRQKTPVDQLTAIRAAIEGNKSNWRMAIIDEGTFAIRLTEFLNEIAMLEPFLRGDKAWGEGMRWGEKQL